ncbi:hypothetical protein [Anaerobacillus alkalidiazotrophicus]|uniref:hypothetical protein n=1 Tax=Anaerobacillus alkalidiazotrophicus TaxID=472963 RepID=UPI001470C75F|nr:hypothetical protein [Anaerobacillus alkalidiazotrophicus]
MGPKQIIIGLLVFIIITVVTFFLLNLILQLPEGVSVIIAIVVGLLAEVLYRKKARSRT